MRIKKTSQYIEGGAGLPSYFTDEIDTGMKWIDGKPIYRKVITFSNQAINNTITLNTGINNMDTCTNFNFILNDRRTGAKIDRFNTMVSTDGEKVLVPRLNNTGATIEFNGLDSYGANEQRTLIFILEYTKTTD